MPSVLRDLTTPRDRPRYAIDDGRFVDMRSPYDLTVEEFEQLEGLFMAYGFILDNPAQYRSKKEIVERNRITREIVTIALGTFDAYDVLGDMRSSMVINDFFGLCVPIVTSLQARGAIPEAIKSLSRSSSHSSPASTAEPPARGRRKRQ